LNEIDIGCRIIAATNRDLASFVNDGYFRNDLFYRLSVFQVELPPLRERQGDVEVLSRYFLDSICRDHGITPKRLAPETMDLLRRYPWPGNVRELKNALEGALIVCEGDVVRPEHIVLRRRSSERGDQQPQAQTSNPDEIVIRIPKSGMTLNEVERQMLITTLGLANFNQSQAARMLGVSRPTIVRMMEKHGVQTRRQLVSE
jgi:DNA-binding NtrC family response regulator